MAPELSPRRQQILDEFFADQQKARAAKLSPEEKKRGLTIDWHSAKIGASLLVAAGLVAYVGGEMMESNSAKPTHPESSDAERMNQKIKTPEHDTTMQDNDGFDWSRIHLDPQLRQTDL